MAQRGHFQHLGGRRVAGEDLTKMTPGVEAMIPGLGDQASFAMYALTVRKGDAAFMIRLNLPTRLSHAMRQGGEKEHNNMLTIFLPWIRRWPRRR